ncbi:hypothetical protein AVEN_124157-1, partial [Araneus ventricosus]
SKKSPLRSLRENGRGRPPSLRRRPRAPSLRIIGQGSRKGVRHTFPEPRVEDDLQEASFLVDLMETTAQDDEGHE